MSSKPVLYSQFLSSCSYRVRIVLALKHIDYEYKAIDLYNNEQHSPEFMNLNSMAQVPVLDIDGEQLSQSLAIIEYLDERYPEPKLLPKDLILRQKARAIAELIVSGIHPLQNKSLLFRLDEEKRSGWALHYINKGFRALEAVLAKTAGQYCVGDSLTIADVCLVPMVYQAKRLGVDMAPYPVVEKLNRSLEELPSFRLGHPRCQPDTPANMREEDPYKRC
ncbi:maleylacetoacetate isomerase [Ixodes scapularis]